MSRHDHEPYAWVPTFLDELAKSPNVSAAARTAGITRKAAYDYRQANPEFAEAWQDALEQSTDALVGEMHRRAVEGVDEPVFYLGSVCGHKRHYSDTLAIFLAKAHRPETYGDKSKVDLTTNGESINTVFYIPSNGRDAEPEPGD